MASSPVVVGAMAVLMFFGSIEEFSGAFLLVVSEKTVGHNYSSNRKDCRHNYSSEHEPKSEESNSMRCPPYLASWEHLPTQLLSGGPENFFS